ncbi:MAG: hypothetical protein RLZZ422_2702 [Pseudomonadota bacterium]|jgi:uncharacterized protein YfaS (alpha-2-macroglobulin family)
MSKNILWLLLFCIGLNLGILNSVAATAPNPSNQTILSEMVVMSFTEQSVDNLPALVLTFSQLLNPYQDFNNFITLTANGVQVKGIWQVANNPKQLYFNAINPDSAYRVQIRPGLSSGNDLKIMLPVDLTLKTKPLEPIFDFTTKAGILPSQLTEGLPIRVLNVPELDLEFLRVEAQNLPQVLQQLNLGKGFNIYDLNNIRNLTTSVYSTRHITNAKPNTNTLSIIPVESISALKSSGLYFAVMRQPGTFGEQAYRVTYFTVTDLSLHVRRYSKTLDVFAHTIKSGKMLDNLSIQLYGVKDVITEKTNNEGHAHFSNLPDGAFLVSAMIDNNLAFIDLRDDALPLTTYTSTKRKDQPIDVFFHSSRTLFRPTDSVELLFLLRDRDGLSVGIDKVSIRLIQPDQKIIRNEIVNAQENKLGYFNTNFTLPDNSAMGEWLLEVRLNDSDKEALNTFKFKVQAYNSEWLNLKFSSSTQNNDDNRKIILALQGETYNHQPASRYQVQIQQQVSLLRNPLPSKAKFLFGDPRDIEKIKLTNDHQLALSTSGGAFVEINGKDFNTQTPLRFSFNAKLVESGGYSIERQLTQNYWPANTLVGVKPLFDNNDVAANSNVTFEVAKFDQKGGYVAANNIMASLLKVEHYYTWNYTKTDGWQKIDNEQITPISQRTLQLNDTSTTLLSFPVLEGEYWLELEDPNTHFKTAYYFQAGWLLKSNKVVKKLEEVKLALDKNSYAVGELAKLSIHSPFEGEAIVTVESDKLLWSKQLKLSNQETSLDIPIESDWNRHDIYISVISLRPSSKQDNTIPNRAIGLIALPMNRDNRTLGLTIDVPNKVLPESLVTFKITANNLKDSDALVVLTAADYDLSKNNIANPASYFFDTKQYEVKQYDDYNKVLSMLETPVVSSSNNKIIQDQEKHSRSDFKYSTIQTLFSSPVSFNDQGEAFIKLTMPNESRKLRLTALAFGEEQLGAVQQDLLVQAPVEFKANMPPFLAAEDESRLLVTLVNKSDQPQQVNLKIGTNDLLNLASTAEHEYLLEKDQIKVLELPIKASKRFGNGSVELELTGKSFSVHQKLNVLVRSAYPRLQRSRLYNITNEDGAVTLDRSIIQNLQTDSLRARLTLSSTPELSMRASVDDLFIYPYQSLEAIVSKHYPYLFLDANQANNLGLMPLTFADRDYHIQQAIAQLSGLQLSNGGFTAWTGQFEADPWLSAYVGDFLLDAQEQNFKVPDYLLKGVLSYLELQLGDPAAFINLNVDNPEHYAFAARAYSAYVLARVKRVSLANLRAWYDQYKKDALSSLPLVHMGLALYLRTDAQRSLEAFKEALTVKRDDKLDLGDYGSTIRDEAWSLTLLLQHEIDIPQLSERVKELNRLVYIRNYYTTLEQKALFQLGRALSLTQNFPTWSVELMLQSRGLRVNQSGSYRLDISARDLNAGVTLQADNSAAVNTTLEVQGYTQPPIAEKTDFFQVQRTLFDIKGKIKTPDQLQLGDLVIVQLKASANDEVHRALLVDLLPGGWVLDQRLLRNQPELAALILEGMDKPISQLLEGNNLIAEHFALDRYWAVLPLNKKAPKYLYYLVRVAAVGQFRQPPSTLTDLDFPERLGIGNGIERFTIQSGNEEKYE